MGPRFWNLLMPMCGASAFIITPSLLAHELRLLFLSISPTSSVACRRPNCLQSPQLTSSSPAAESPPCLARSSAAIVSTPRLCFCVLGLVKNESSPSLHPHTPTPGRLLSGLPGILVEVFSCFLPFVPPFLFKGALVPSNDPSPARAPLVS